MTRRLELGQTATARRTFTSADLAEFCALAGADLGTPPSVPGPLLGGMISYLLGTHLPGPGTNYLKQDLEYLEPAPVGEEITAQVQVVRVRPEKQLVNLYTLCTNASGAVLCRGQALVLVKDVA